MYRWMSAQTGELACGLKDVIKVIIADLRYYHSVNIIWKYNKKGW